MFFSSMLALVLQVLDLNLHERQETTKIQCKGCSEYLQA